MLSDRTGSEKRGVYRTPVVELPSLLRSPSGTHASLRRDPGLRHLKQLRHFLDFQWFSCRIWIVTLCIAHFLVHLAMLSGRCGSEREWKRANGKGRGQGRREWCPPWPTANGMKGSPDPWFSEDWAGGTVAACGRHGALLENRCLRSALLRILLLMA